MHLFQIKLQFQIQFYQDKKFASEYFNFKIFVIKLQGFFGRGGDG